MDTTEQAVAEHITGLINLGKFHEAYRQVGAYIDEANSRGDVSAHLWFQRVLTGNLTGQSVASDVAALRKAPDYSGLMEGDLWRDEMLRAIRQGDLTRANDLRHKIVRYHRSDPNRMAAYVMAVARLRFAQGRWQSAARLHALADSLWCKLGPDADAQWMRSNRFHWLRALVAAERSSKGLYRYIMADEPRRDRRWRATFLFTFGASGSTFDNWLEQRVSR